MRKTRQLSLKDCYDILQLPKSATLDDVKKAYRKRAFELHPDLNPDSPHAGYQFQDLNEAYVALSHVLETEEAKRQTAAAAAAAAEEKRQQEKAYKEAGRRAARQEKEREREAQAKEREERAREREEKAKAQAKARAEAQIRAEAEDWQKKREEAAEKMYAERQKASQAYAQEDVLRDLLDDPFARRVFEDIYSEVNRQGGKAPSSDTQTDDQNTAQKASAQQVESASEKSAQSTAQSQAHTSSKSETTKPSAKASPPPTAKVDLVEEASSSGNSFSSKIKGWFRHQIDDEQTIKMPAQTLFAGARIRLQIRRGLSEELSTVEITLPKEFVVGKPFRLRGLGKKVGKWQGDLYLTIQSK